MLGSTTDRRYTTVAITLHWVIALSIIALLIAGLVMSEDDLLEKSLRFQVIQLHKSLGLTVLVLSFIRLLWRLMHKPPALPPTMPAWEKYAAAATHFAFYILMFALPLTGWALVSTSSWGLPTIWFGLFEWPHLPILSTLADKKPANEIFGETHEILAYITIALIFLHVGAAMKHYLWNRDEVLSHMLPFLKPLKPKV